MRSFVIVLFFVPLLINAQVVSPFNKLPIGIKHPSSYSFFVGGHFHGSSANVSGFPAASLLANIDEINSDSAAFIVSTGDLFIDIKNNIPNYQKSFFNKIKIPLFNAVGNHDISGDVYNSNFGKTWSHFIVGSEMYILLDAEINDGSFKGEQLEFFKEVLETNCGEHSAVKNIFIFTHRPIWAENDEKLKNVFLENTKSDFSNNFSGEVLPMIQKYTATHKFYWCSGSLGGNAPASFFYYAPQKNITYIQSAIRDLPRDGILKVLVKDGIVSFETISFSDQKMPSLTSCDLNMWKRAPVQSSFNTRLIPLYIKQMIFHRYFWYGLLAGIVLIYLLKRLFRKFKRISVQRHNKK